MKRTTLAALVPVIWIAAVQAQQMPAMPGMNMRRTMRKVALFATSLIFAGTGFTLAVPANPVVGDVVLAPTDGAIHQVAPTKAEKSAKTNKNDPKAKKKNSTPRGGINMERMPPGHKM